MSGRLTRRLRTRPNTISEFLVEKFIPGRELTIGVLGDLALPIIEIIPKGGFYDFTNKYPFLNPSAGGGAEHVCPAEIPEERTRAIQDLALRAHRSLGLQVYSRVDIMLPEERRSDGARNQHHPGNDRGESAAGGGGRRRHQLSGIVRADHRTFAAADAEPGQ